MVLFLGSMMVEEPIQAHSCSDKTKINIYIFKEIVIKTERGDTGKRNVCVYKHTEVANTVPIE